MIRLEQPPESDKRCLTSGAGLFLGAPSVAARATEPFCCRHRCLEPIERDRDYRTTAAIRSELALDRREGLRRLRFFDYSGRRMLGLPEINVKDNGD
jgi:hypothetical protein